MFIKQTCNHVHVFCHDFNAVKNMWNNFYSIVKSFFTLFFFRYESKCDFFYEKGLKFSISEWIHEKLWIWGTTHWQATSCEFTKFSWIHTWIQKIMYLGSKKRTDKKWHILLCRWIHTWIYILWIHKWIYTWFWDQVSWSYITRSYVDVSRSPYEYIYIYIYIYIIFI